LQDSVGTHICQLRAKFEARYVRFWPCAADTAWSS